MYLRMGWIVGQSGITQAIIIVSVASGITLLTTLSMSAICTNGEVRGGGAYYMISRTMGPTIGGAVGILFALGNAVAASMYNIGFVETTLELTGGSFITGDDINDTRLLSIILLFLQLMISLRGLDWIIKIQMGLLLVIILSLLLLVVGFFTTHDEDNLIFGFEGEKGLTKENARPNYGVSEGIEYNFFTVLGVFFPAVTGIMAGANISGELKNPGHAIPKGTIYAVVSSWLFYCLIAFLAGASIGRGTHDGSIGLLGDYLIFEKTCVFGPIIIMGIYGATLSSAFGCLVGAPRILQAVAEDSILPLDYFAVTSSNGDPVRGYWLCFVIAAGCSLIGSLNAIAPLISSFFIITYAVLNFSVYAQSYGRHPNWRPKFKYYNYRVSFWTGICCVVIMFLMSWMYAAIASGVTLLIMFYIYQKSFELDWGTIPDAFTEYQVVKRLYGLSHLTEASSYRPHFLILSGDPNNRKGLVYFGQCLKKGYGALIYGNVHIGNYKTFYERQIKNNGYLGVNYISGTKGFYEQVCCDSLRLGIHMLVQSSGMGHIRPNAVT
eukprot:UN29644